MPLATHSVLPDGFRVLECRKADLVKRTGRMGWADP